MSVNSVSGTDATKNAEKLLEFQMMTQIFKKALGDSDSFSMVMESLTQAMSNKDGSINLSNLGLGEDDLSKLGYGGGERLNTVYNGIKNDMKSGNMTIDQAVDSASRKYGVDKNLIMAVIKQESDFNPNSTSGAGAEGLMQLMPGTAAELGVSDPYNVQQNVNGGTEYLKSLLDMYGNSKELALAAYNAGYGTLKSRGVNDASKISRLPYETRDYVQKIMGYYNGKTV